MDGKKFALQILDNYVRAYIARGHDFSDLIQHSHLEIDEKIFKEVTLGNVPLNEADFYSLTDSFRFYEEMENPSVKFPSRIDWFLKQLHWYLVERLEPSFKLVRQDKNIRAIFDFPVVLINDSTVLIEVGDSLVHIASKDRLNVKDIKREFYSGGSKPAYLLEVERVNQIMETNERNTSQGHDAQNVNLAGATINGPVSINKSSDSTSIDWKNIFKWLYNLIKTWKIWVLF